MVSVPSSQRYGTCGLAGQHSRAGVGQVHARRPRRGTVGFVFGGTFLLWLTVRCRHYVVVWVLAGGRECRAREQLTRRPP
jgi:hypothetical protein